MESLRTRCRGQSLRPLLAGIVAIAACAGPARAEGGSVVYYQVTYTNGKIRDLSTPPPTDKGIRRVLRISRIEGPYPGLSILSVDRSGVSVVRTGRTIRTELGWNGRAWVGQVEAPKPPPTSRPAEPAALNRQRRRQELISQLKEKLKAAQEHHQTCDKAVIQAAELLAKAKGTDGEKPAMLLLGQAQAARQEGLEEILQLEGLLSELTAGPPGGRFGPPGRETGRVVAARPGEFRKGNLGVVRPIQGRRVLPHRLHMWKLPPGHGRRTYTVAMAHPEAGLLGAFHYVAYTDSDRDGVPDTLIAHSPPAVAATPGGWTSWQFTTSAERLFVGNAWRYGDTVHYYSAGQDALLNCRGLGTDVYVSGYPHGAPFRRWGRPYFGNIRVHVGQQISD